MNIAQYATAEIRKAGPIVMQLQKTREKAAVARLDRETTAMLARMDELIGPQNALHLATTSDTHRAEMLDLLDSVKGSLRKSGDWAAAARAMPRTAPSRGVLLRFAIGYGERMERLQQQIETRYVELFGVPPVAEPRGEPSALGRKLAAIRARIVASGTHLLDSEELTHELQLRRGGVGDA